LQESHPPDAAVDLRDVQGAPVQHLAAEGAEHPVAGAEERPLWTRNGESFLTTPLGSRAAAVFMIFGISLFLQDSFPDALNGGRDTADFILMCATMLLLALKGLFEVRIPAWLTRVFLVALAASLLAELFF
jgi:hypothetical protein